jgi:hypothetical protein
MSKPQPSNALDSKSAATSGKTVGEEFPVHFCPVCSARLESRRCKMICPRCGYFMSCSEFE